MVVGIRPTVTEKSLCVGLEDISIAVDSSWRDFDREAVDGHKETIKAGKYGDTVYKGPSYLDKLTSGIDGKQLLNDGKSMVTALIETKVEAAELGNLSEWKVAMDKKVGGAPPEVWADVLEDCPQWIVPELLGVYVDGLTGPAYVYPENNRTYHRIVMCEMHEETNQKWEKTGLASKIKNVRDWMGLQFTIGGKLPWGAL